MMRIPERGRGCVAAHEADQGPLDIAQPECLADKLVHPRSDEAGAARHHQMRYRAERDRFLKRGNRLEGKTGCGVGIDGHPLGGAGGSPHGDPRLRTRRVVLAHHVVAAEVEAVVGVEVADEDGVDLERVGVAVQLAERAVAEVEQHPPGATLVLLLEEVAARRGLRAVVGAGTADDREPHRSLPANWLAPSSSEPRNRRPIEAKSSGLPVVEKV